MSKLLKGSIVTGLFPFAIVLGIIAGALACCYAATVFSMYVYNSL